MVDWGLWFAAAGILVAVEIFTGTFYLLMLALGCIAGGIAAVLGLGMPFQFSLSALVGLIATLLLTKSRFNPKRFHQPQQDPNMNMDIGNTVVINEWQTLSEGISRARISYRGAMWDVELSKEAQAKSGTFVIQEIRSNRLIVKNMAE